MRTSPPKNTVPFHTVQDIADLLGVSSRSVSRWIETDQLKAHKLGHLVRISGDDLQQFLAARRG
jgi:excisionase family DNA binding protein